MNPVEIRMPDLSQFMLVTLVRWHVPDGAHVAVDQDLCEVETDSEQANCVVSWPAPASGTLEQLVPAGSKLHDNQVIGWIVPAH